MMRARALILLLGLTAAGASGCGPKPAGTLRPRPLVGLHIECQPDDAEIYVDDRFMGSVKGLDIKPLKLSPGAHRLELRKEGYFAHFAEVKLEPGLKQRVRIKLRKEPF